jgi:hypothetical protein
MATKIIPKKSTVAAKVPLVGDLDQGELAINLTDKKIYTKDGSNNIIELSPNTDTLTNQTITLSGDATGSGTTSIVVTIADDSHNHIISNIDGLQTILDGAVTYDSTTTSTGYLQLSVGTTAQRPTAAVGMVRYNTTRGCFEGYTGSGWVNMSPLTIDGVGEIV